MRPRGRAASDATLRALGITYAADTMVVFAITQPRHAGVGCGPMQRSVTDLAHVIRARCGDRPRVSEVGTSPRSPPLRGAEVLAAHDISWPRTPQKRRCT